MNDGKFFSTRDIYLASTLITLKFPLKSVDYQQEGINNRLTGYFNFEDTPEIHGAEQKYWDRSLVVEPLLFVTNLKGLKAQVVGQYKSPRTNGNYGGGYSSSYKKYRSY
jgi:hypothetical protein